MAFSVPLALPRVLATLLPALDIVAQRVDDAHVPAWCSARGWSEYLLALSDQDLERCEAEGLAVVAEGLPGIPESLAELAAQIRSLSDLPVLAALLSTPEHDFRGVSRRKQEQLSALLAALPPLAAAAKRIVDVGAGSGHFTRLSARHFSREALGLERNPERVARASSREQASADTEFSAQFTIVDALRDGIALYPTDLAIGLHACGELGDALVRAAAAQGADLVLVSCCLQKISTPERAPLSRAGARLALYKDTLGLSNLSSQAVGVEASIAHTMQARQARYALRQLLLTRGLVVPPGAEMHGINRRRAHTGFAEIAARALAFRDLPPLGAAEASIIEQRAAPEFAAIRRLSLPRDMLARVIELAVVLDRAAHLAERGYAVRLATLFERAVTPRNIALFASRDASRLPEVRNAET
jgi:SAM-dependent methyltransferase